MDKMHKHSYQEMFVHRTMGIIDPSPDQKDSLLPIVENYADKALELKKNVSQSFDSLMKEMNLALKPYLTDDQYNKLEQTAMRYRSRADRPQ
ncbi:MAG: hypothetical protein H7A26_09020 [Spirochaetales bacterium]|nr:hypothetical protein [Spirochaetales bacterium]